MSVENKVFNPEVIGKAVRLKGQDIIGSKWDEIFLVKGVRDEYIMLVDSFGVDLEPLHIECFNEENNLLTIKILEEGDEVQTEYVYMVQIETYFGEKQVDVSNYGAFKSFRSASEWLIGEGYEAFYDDEISELLRIETIQFIFVDAANNETYLAHIETYTVHE